MPTAPLCVLCSATMKLPSAQRFSHLFCACIVAFSFGCGDDDDTVGPTGSGGNSSAAGGAGGNGGSASGGMGGDAQGGGGGVGGQGGSGGMGGGFDCGAVPSGPFTPALFSAALDGSEDLAFDGKGNIAGKAGGNIVLLDGMGNTTTLAPLNSTTLGVRFMSDGTLLAARPQQSEIAAISPGGAVSSYVAVTGNPNGLFVDFDDNVWVTRFGANTVDRIDAGLNVTTIVSGSEASQANGVVLHPTLPILYYTEYSPARIHCVDVSGSTFTPVQIAEINNAALDGMAMDSCGNLYVVDNQGDRLFRQRLDEAGAPVGTPELLASFPSNVANAQFGSGPGFDSSTIYAAGFPGDVYSVEVGVPGAPVPGAP